MGGMALGLLVQWLGSSQRPVDYFCKQLDVVSEGWPSCLHAVAAIALLMREAQKLTISQSLVIQTLHSVKTVLDQKASRWLTSNRMPQYQTQLLETPEIKLQPCNVLKPATLLPISEEQLTPD